MNHSESNDVDLDDNEHPSRPNTWQREQSNCTRNSFQSSNGSLVANATVRDITGHWASGCCGRTYGPLCRLLPSFVFDSHHTFSTRIIFRTLAFAPKTLFGALNSSSPRYTEWLTIMCVFGMGVLPTGWSDWADKRNNWPLAIRHRQTCEQWDWGKKQRIQCNYSYAPYPIRNDYENKNCYR